MMTVQALNERSGSICELCGANSPEHVLEVVPSDGSVDQSLLVCSVCNDQITENIPLDNNHFRCLSNAMWSPVPAVQVMAYRLLHKLSTHGWAKDLLDTIYLEPEVQAWADQGLDSDSDDSAPTKDSNGAKLLDGDSVTLIKDLDVKGAGFVAKRGTMVKNISLTNDSANIEGRVNGMRIVLKTCFLKKA